MKINSSALNNAASSCKVMRKRSVNMRSSSAENVAFQVAAIKKAAVKMHLASRIMLMNEAFLRAVTDACVIGFDEPSGAAEAMMASYVGKFISNEVIRPEDLCTEAVVQAAYRMNDIQYVSQWVAGRIADMKFATKKTAAIQANIAASQVRRYCSCESRVPLMVYCPQRTVSMSGGLEVDTAPDVIFGGSAVEAVKIRTGRPDITVSSKSKSVKTVDGSLEMYAMLKYAAEYASEVYGVSEILNVASSYYFLRRDDDTASHFDLAFFPYQYKNTETGRNCFNNGHNVVTLSCTTVEGKKLPSDVADHYEALASVFGEGESCTEEMCASCPRNELCNYRKAPIASQDMKPRLKATEIQLSPDQEKVIDFRKGVARVNAGAGAGKTLVVALRTAYMISEGVDPASMLLITFTHAGADEMKERIMFYMDDLGIDTEGMNLNVTTFNAFGNSIIVSEYKRLGFSKAPRLIDDIERKSIIRSLLNDNVIDGLDYRNFTMNFGYARGALAVVSDMFAYIKKNRLSIYDGDALEAHVKDSGIDGSISGNIRDACEQVLRLYLKYDQKLKDDCLIEYADQEGLVFDLLDMDPYYFDSLGIAHITVDEYQDTSETQNELVKKLCESESFESLLAVGDDSQSIFSFRDANPENIVNFFETFGPGEDLFLVENYRCSPEIIAFANKVNSRNVMRVDKDLVATRASKGIPVRVLKFENRKKNYEWIADSVAAKIKAGTAPSDIEIQAATKAELLEMASVLTSKGIETFVSCPEPMLDNSRVKGIIAMNAAIINPRASKSILEYLNALCDGCLMEMSDSEIESLEKEYEDKFARFSLLSEAEKVSIFDDRAAEIAGGDDVAVNFAERLKRFNRIADKSKYIHDFIELGGEMLKRTDRLDGVTLSTVHSSKGLEWPIVYIIQTKFVSASGRFDEERRRLLFVAATRAKDELYVTGLSYLGRGKSKSYNIMLAECELDAAE